MCLPFHPKWERLYFASAAVACLVHYHLDQPDRAEPIGELLMNLRGAKLRNDFFMASKHRILLTLLLTVLLLEVYKKQLSMH